MAAHDRKNRNHRDSGNAYEEMDDGLNSYEGDSYDEAHQLYAPDKQIEEPQRRKARDAPHQDDYNRN